MKHRILWSNNAKEELMEIIQYIQIRSGKDQAKKVFERIQTQLSKIKEFPESQRGVPELKEIGVSDINELIESPWRIFYKVQNKEIRILSIIDGRRNVEELLYKKIIDGKLT